MNVEAGTLLTPEGVRERARLKLEGAGSLYVETVIAPGFADAHAHPQVVDVGEGLWSNSYEWMSKRRLRVDEAALRADIDLSSRLAEASMLRALLEGVTLMALVGRAEANLLAYRRMPVKPRVVVMPTILDVMRGWPTTWSAANLVISLSHLDSRVPMGLFVHSLGGVSSKALRAAYVTARSFNLPFGLHLNEGLDELHQLVTLLGLREGEDSGIIAVHCIVDGDFERYGIRVVHCPLSNLRLYGRTLADPTKVDALGSDWPLLLGSALSTYRGAVRVHGKEHASLLLAKATWGGYEVYGVPWSGDWVGFDEPLERVLKGEAEPSFVAVAGRIVVEERRLLGYGYDRSDVDRLVDELVKLAIEKHPAETVIQQA
ncbi:MAG: hypothetical protein QXJ59_01595 [Thermofilaceae archaeon]